MKIHKIQSDRIILNQDKNKDYSLNVSFSSNNSYYEQLDDDIKKDIIFLIKSGYDKRAIIKLYLLQRPSNVNEAIHYLTKENGVFQHMFYSSTKMNDACEICGESKDAHITYNYKSINHSSYSNFSYLPIKTEVIFVQRKKEQNFKCKICEEMIEKNLIKQCEKCQYYFCDECLYLHIKELIKNGKYELFCPQCNNIYSNEKIEEIFALSGENKNEINNLKELFEKSITKNIILTNPNLMFCPIKDCQGYAKKNIKSNYNICNKNHKFCSKCGEAWHEKEICPEEEEVDKLFKQYCKKINSKKCPYCQIVTFKKGGCNHITCTFCKKDWCWLCKEVFKSTEEHYGNINKRCYNKMMDNTNEMICSNCENTTNSYKLFSECEHLVCQKCFEIFLLENDILRLTRKINIKCIVEGCNIISNFSGRNIIDFINKINDKNINNKYRKQIIFFKYNFCDFFLLLFKLCFEDYFNLCLFELYERIYNFFNKKFGDCKGYIFLEILGIFLASLFIIFYVIIFPVSFHIMVKKLYYKYFKETIKEYNFRLILPIMVIEEILFLIFLFPFICFHYVWASIFPIYIIIGLIIFGIIELCKKCKK